ncbi:MAG: GNAT family N-acetyltransferase [bacterium]
MKNEISDGVIRLRPNRPDDAEDIFEAVAESKKELRPWIPWCHENYSIEDTRTWLAGRDDEWKKGINYDLAIEDADTGAYIGGTGVVNIAPAHKRGEIGYWVRTSRSGRGIAVAAARLCARFAFEELGLKRVEIIIATDNSRSHRVAEKLGAKFESVRRNYYNLNGVQRNAAAYSLIPGDV